MRICLLDLHCLHLTTDRRIFVQSFESEKESPEGHLDQLPAMNRGTYSSIRLLRAPPAWPWVSPGTGHPPPLCTTCSSASAESPHWKQVHELVTDVTFETFDRFQKQILLLHGGKASKSHSFINRTKKNTLRWVLLFWKGYFPCLNIPVTWIELSCSQQHSGFIF